MVICHQGMIWHGGQEGPATERVTLADEIRNAVVLSHYSGVMPSTQGPIVVNGTGAGG